jgi:hypothetical protein
LRPEKQAFFDKMSKMSKVLTFVLGREMQQPVESATQDRKTWQHPGAPRRSRNGTEETMEEELNHQGTKDILGAGMSQSIRSDSQGRQALVSEPSVIESSLFLVP